MTSKAYRNLSEAELELVAGGAMTALIPEIESQVGGGRDDSAGSGSGSQGGGSNLDVPQETQPELS